METINHQHSTGNGKLNVSFLVWHLEVNNRSGKRRCTNRDSPASHFLEPKYSIMDYGLSKYPGINVLTALTRENNTA